MNMRTGILSIILLSVSIFVSAQIPVSVQQSFQQIIDNALVSPGVKGISACVIWSDNSVWTGQAGTNGDGVSVSDSSVFYAGSTTKTFVATRILQLWDEGLIHLDTAYITYIDTIDNVLPQITIRQMLNHTSGIYDYDEHPSFFIDLFLSPNHLFTPAEILMNYVDQPHVFSPGSNHEYSNSNYLILAMIIEAVSGNTLADELRFNILDSMHLAHTYLGAFETITEPHAGLWMYVDTTLTNMNAFPHTSLLSSAFGAGNIVSIPYDESVFIRKLVNGEIISQSALGEMKVMNTFSDDYGLGLMSFPIGVDTSIYGHNGGIGNLTEMFHCPELNLTVTVMQNSENGDAMPFNYLFLSAYNYLISSVSSNLSKPDFTFYPNPAHDFLFINFDDEAAREIQIFSLDGRLLYALKLNQNSVKIDLSSFQNSVYLVNIISNTGKNAFKFLRN